MEYTTSTSDQAQKAILLVRSLQEKFVQALESLDERHPKFEAVHWLRDEGSHGGGTRYVSMESPLFNRASINVSHVHYDDYPEKKLASATALSAIVHPNHPHRPSTHMHFSWTEMRDGSGYWRMMADLNPSLPNAAHKKTFDDQLIAYAGDHYEQGTAQGDQYFYIPALEVHRGVSHFYLEGFDSGNFNQDYQLAETLASQMIDVYIEILSSSGGNDCTQEEKQTQIDYHTFYLYQVLTLDKGTIAGILVHDQNDLGVMGSLPAEVNGELLHSWIDKTVAPFNELVQAISAIVGHSKTAPVEDVQKLGFVKSIRSFYAQHPELANFKNGSSSKG